MRGELVVEIRVHRKQAHEHARKPIGYGSTDGHLQRTATGRHARVPPIPEAHVGETGQQAQAKAGAESEAR